MNGDRSRFPFANLERFVPAHTNRDIATELGVTRRTVHRCRVRGLSTTEADRYSLRLGLHPAIVWEEWTRAC